MIFKIFMDKDRNVYFSIFSKLFMNFYEIKVKKISQKKKLLHKLFILKHTELLLDSRYPTPTPLILTYEHHVFMMNLFFILPIKKHIILEWAVCLSLDDVQISHTCSL